MHDLEVVYVERRSRCHRHSLRARQCINGVEQKVEKDIVETAVASGKFKTLVTAVQAGELVDTLKGKGPFTVFAPTDEAFAKLPKGTLESLLKDKKGLAAVLTYHVVPGKVMEADVVKLTTAMTAQGQVGIWLPSHEL